jgi:hypothetical protein
VVTRGNEARSARHSASSPTGNACVNRCATNARGRFGPSGRDGRHGRAPGRS